jgi:hypothetical protein
MRQLNIAAALVLAAFSLAGCAAFDNIKSALSAAGNFTVTQKQVDAARSGYDGAVLVPLDKYASFPRCAPGKPISISNLCHDAPLLKQIRASDKVVAAAFDRTQDLITSGNNDGATAAWSSLQTAIDSAKQLIAIAKGGVF